MKKSWVGILSVILLFLAAVLEFAAEKFLLGGIFLLVAIANIFIFLKFRSNNK